MGDGLILESGTHSELLADETGAYYRLVEAQKLREARDKSAGADVEETEDSGSSAKHDSEEFDEKAAEEVPLGRVNTSGTTGSETLAKARLEARKTTEDYSMTYLFRRIAAINRDQLPRYILGGIGAISMCYLAISSHFN